MSTVKVSSGAPVGPSTPMTKLANARLASTSSAPVSAVSDSAGVSTSTDQPMFSDQQSLEKNPYVFVQEEETVVPAYTPLEVDFPLIEGEADEKEEVSPIGAFLSVQDAVRQVGSYEQALEASEALPKKSTKAFG